MFLFNLITSLKILKLMCYSSKKNNKRTKKHVNLFWQDSAKAYVQTSIEKKSPKRQGMDSRQGYRQNSKLIKGLLGQDGENT